MEIAEFLLARIAEDEAVALAASPGPWHLNAEHDEVLAVDEITVCDGFALSGPQTRATTEHIARHDPARVLVECEAKRRILEVFQRIAALDYPHSIMGDDGRPTPVPLRALVQHHDHLARLLALPYADHPDYGEEWRP